MTDPTINTLSFADGETPVSWASEVIADSTGKWYRNALRFATEAEALASANELASRWYMVRATRAAPAIERPNYRFIDGRNVRLENDASPEQRLEDRAEFLADKLGLSLQLATIWVKENPDKAWRTDAIRELKEWASA